jgi:hypothetical protein
MLSSEKKAEWRVEPQEWASLTAEMQEPGTWEVMKEDSPQKSNEWKCSSKSLRA